MKGENWKSLSRLTPVVFFDPFSIFLLFVLAIFSGKCYRVLIFGYYLLLCKNTHKCISIYCITNYLQSSHTKPLEVTLGKKNLSNYLPQKSDIPTKLFCFKSYILITFIFCCFLTGPV